VSQQVGSEPDTIDLRKFSGLVRRHRWLIALVALLVVVLALGFVLYAKAQYTSTARVQVRPLLATSELQGLVSTADDMQTQAQTITSQPIMERARRELQMAGVSSDPRHIATAVKVSVPSNTTFLDISCTQLSPAAAQACAGSLAKAYIVDRTRVAEGAHRTARKPFRDQIEAERKTIEDRTAQLATATPDQKVALNQEIADARAQVATATLQLLSIPAPSSTPAILSVPADLPREPSNRNYLGVGLTATLLGLALGIGVAVLREQFDERIRGREGLEHAIGAPVLAAIPKLRRRGYARGSAFLLQESAASEAYRTARTTLLYLAAADDLKIIEMIGPSQGEGKTTTTACLAVSLAQGGKRVLAISCDLRLPQLHRFLELENEVGLTDLLTGKATIPQIIKKTSLPNLLFVSSGSVPKDPADLLGSITMARFLEGVRSQADFVLLDTPPALLVADALALAPASDGVIVIADALSSKRGALTQVRHQLDQVGANVIGGILNNVDTMQHSGYHGYLDRDHLVGQNGSDPERHVVGKAGVPDGSPEKQVDGMWR
jgi:tyrosine-protein kinase